MDRVQRVAATTEAKFPAAEHLDAARYLHQEVTPLFTEGRYGHPTGQRLLRRRRRTGPTRRVVGVRHGRAWHRPTGPIGHCPVQRPRRTPTPTLRTQAVARGQLVLVLVVARLNEQVPDVVDSGSESSRLHALAALLLPPLPDAMFRSSGRPVGRPLAISVGFRPDRANKASLCHSDNSFSPTGTSAYRYSWRKLAIALEVTCVKGGSREER
jgi:hypothetical protein